MPGPIFFPSVDAVLFPYRTGTAIRAAHSLMQSKGHPNSKEEEKK